MSRRSRIELVPALMLEMHIGAPKPHKEAWSRDPGDRRARATEPHYLRLVAANGQTLATSELFANKANAKRAVQAWLTAFRDVGDAASAAGEPVYKEVEA